MDAAIIVAVLGLIGTLATAAIAWHASTSNNRTRRRDAAHRAAQRGLAEARAATAAERREYERLRDERLRESAEQLGATRIALAECQMENAALRDQLGQQQQKGLT